MADQTSGVPHGGSSNSGSSNGGSPTQSTLVQRAGLGDDQTLADGDQAASESDQAVIDRIVAEGGGQAALDRARQARGHNNAQREESAKARIASAAARTRRTRARSRGARARSCRRAA